MLGVLSNGPPLRMTEVPFEPDPFSPSAPDPAHYRRPNYGSTMFHPTTLPIGIDSTLGLEQWIRTTLGS